MKEQMAKPERDRRPFLASECDNPQDAELWRRDIIREVTKSVHLIQNAGAGEHKIRDLNDQINKLLRERVHWDKRIVELGGPDYAASAPKSYDADGRELPGGGGYRCVGDRNIKISNYRNIEKYRSKYRSIEISKYPVSQVSKLL